MTPQPVRRRHVFFFSGFDPKGAAYYHRLYQEGAALQQQATGDSYQVGGRERTAQRHVQRWQVAWQPAGQPAGEPTATTYEFLAWDDVVRAHWPHGVLGVAWGSVLAYAAALSSGTALLRVRRASPRTLLALVYPAVFWLLALVLGLLAGALVLQQLPRAWAPAGLSALAPGAAWCLAGLAAAAIGWGALRIERKLHTSWLLRIYRFADLWASGRLPDLEQRLDDMAERVLQRLRQADADEVLLVGYSVGSMLSASVLARVLATLGAEPAARQSVRQLAMLTLGQCVPLLGLMPRAHAFRRELAFLAATPALCWTDYSSPGDWGSFALVDPLRICRIAASGTRSLEPRMLSPRFHTLFAPDEYAILRKNKRRLHLQYLMASPKAGAYDYFRLTAGPDRLCSKPGDVPGHEGTD